VSDPGSSPLLAVEELAVEFSVSRRRPPLRAVDGVNFDIRTGETVGLVGESGSGKSTIGRAILGLTPIHSGRVVFQGRDITRYGYHDRRKLSADLQVVFQDPYSSLNPTRPVGRTLSESLRIQRVSRQDVAGRVSSMLQRVGLPTTAASRYPAHFSGGQRQRIAIARALMPLPRLVICDEPVSALDLSVQAQILNLLRDLQREFGLSYLFIAHDLAVVRHLCQRTLVLYRGQIMESGNTTAVHDTPSHPYTRALLDAAPLPNPEEQRRRRGARKARASDDTSQPGSDGCPFAGRCPYAVDLCVEARPPLDRTPEGSLVACHRWEELRTAGELRAASG
jgi:oligopeptide/dipeptide ABC transporter ATP-binding protein